MRIGLQGILGLSIALSAAGVLCGEQIASTCRITAVDVANRTVTLVRKTSSGEKTGVAKVADDAEVRVSDKIAGLNALEVPVDAIVIYDTEKRWLAAITVKSRPSSSQAMPPRPMNSPEIRRLDGHSAPVMSAAYSHDGRWLASGGFDGKVCLWDLTGDSVAPRIKLEPRAGKVKSVVFGRTTSLLAVGGDKAFRLWQFADGNVIERSLPKELEGPAFTLAFSHDDKLLALGQLGTVRLWNIAGSVPVRLAALNLIDVHAPEKLPVDAIPPEGIVWSVAFSQDDKILGCGVGKWPRQQPEPGEVLLFHLSDGATTPAAVLRGHRSAVRSLAFHPSRPVLATASLDGTVQLWDTQMYRAIGRSEHSSIMLACVAFSSNGRLVLACGTDNCIRVSKASTLEEVSRFEGHGGTVSHLAVSPDGRQCASAADDNSVRLWRLPQVAEAVSGKE